jgi:hypothetical protein
MKGPVKTELKRLMDKGSVTKVFSSNWASPTVNVLKNNGSLRICGDFSSSVNKYLDPVQSPLPSIDEVITKVGCATIFSKIDLANAFLQLPLDENSKEYTTINTTEGLFRYNYLPFGLTASPGIFQSFMCKLLNNIDEVIVYQDDILIMSPTVAHHNITLNKVLTTLRDAGIKLNTHKCTFFADKVQYLGHIFDKEGVHPNPEKVRAIVDAPCPNNIKQLQAFLGLCNFYSRFIPNFSDVLSPLYSLLKKNVKFHWGPDQQKCFCVVKSLFTNNKVLKMYNPNYETLLETDSSGYGTAAVLMQRENSNANWCPVQFASRTLNSAEKNYSNIEREALSVVFGCDRFRKFLLGAKFIIRNDQQPLRKLLAHDSNVPTTCSARLQRWALKLSQYNYIFQYSRGQNNVNSDCLSRLPLNDTVHECEPYELIFTVNALNSMPVTCVEIKQHTDLDKDLVQLKHYIKYGCPIRMNNPKLNQFKHIISEMSILKGCILYNSRVFIPQSLRKLVLNQIHEGHPGICAMKSIARSLIWYPGIDKDITELVKSCTQCQSNQSKPPQNRNIEWPVPPRPWSRVHIDHFFFEGKICLIAIDALSKYIECEIVPNVSVDETIDALRIIFSRNGLCDLLVSDNASCFTAQKFKEFLSSNGIQHITPPPFNPASNGQAERAVRVLKDLLKKSNSSGTLKSRLAKVLIYYRCVPHSVTNIPPSVSLNNRKFITAKDRVNPKYCYVHNPDLKSKTIPQLEIGNKVLALNLRDGPKWYQSTVVQKIGINIYNVHIHDLDVVWRRHTNQLLLVAPGETEPHSDSQCKVPTDYTMNGTPGPSRSHHPVSNSVDQPLQNSIPDRLDSGIPSENHDNVTVDPGEPLVDLRRSGRIKKPVVRYGFD